MLNPKNTPNMRRMLDTLEAQSGERVILKYMDGMQVISVTAPKFFSRARKYAAVLHARGLCGTHIGIMGANRMEWLAAFCGIYQAGGVAVLLSPDLNAQELSERIEHADIQGLFYDETLSETVHQTAFPADFIDLNLDSLSEAILDPVSAPESNAEDLACILFTSGTTATAKAVMLSHRAMVAGVCHNVIPCSFDAQLAILPFHHIAGIASVLNTWYLGAVACIGQDFKYLYRYLEHMKPDYTLTVPSMLQVIMKKLRKGGPNGQLLGWNLKLIGCGGAKFQPEAIRFLNDHSIRILQSYGATEAGGLGFDWEMTPECRDTIGKTCPEVETKIVNGELYLRSDSVMMGYYKDMEATQEVLKDGWYATGDLCEQDAEGYLYLRGRKKNLIILSNGENVSPEQIETALYACNAISEVMVGVENNLITATIFPREPAGTAQIRQFIEVYNRSVPSYRQVQNLHFSDRPFARTEIGKMIRRSVTGVTPT